MRKFNDGLMIGALALVLGSAPALGPEVMTGDVKEEAAEALDVAGDYLAQERQELNERGRKAIDDAKQELAEARRELAEVPEESRAALQTAIDRAEAAQTSLGEQLDELQDASQEKWELSKQRISDAIGEVGEARGEIANALTGEEQ